MGKVLENQGSLEYAGKRVAYTTTRGDKLQLEYFPPRDKPICHINGQKLDYDTWKLFDSPYVWADVGARILHVSDGKQGFKVDFTKDLPEYTPLDGVEHSTQPPVSQAGAEAAKAAMMRAQAGLGTPSGAAARRLFTRIAVLLLGLPLLWARGAQAADEVTLMFDPADRARPNIEKLQRAFNRRNPDVRFRIIWSNISPKMHLLTAADALPDLIPLPDFSLVLYHEQFLDLGPYLARTPHDRAQVYPQVAESLPLRGQAEDAAHVLQRAAALLPPGPVSQGGRPVPGSHLDLGHVPRGGQKTDHAPARRQGAGLRHQRRAWDGGSSGGAGAGRRAAT